MTARSTPRLFWNDATLQPKRTPYPTSRHSAALNGGFATGIEFTGDCCSRFRGLQAQWQRCAKHCYSAPIAPEPASQPDRAPSSSEGPDG